MRDFAVIGTSTVRTRNMIVGGPSLVGGPTLIGRLSAVIGVVDPVGVITSPAATKEFATVLAAFVAAGLALGVGGHYAIRAYENRK